MKNLIAYLVVLFTCCSLNVMANDSIPTVSFTLSAHKAYEASTMVINFEVAVDNDNFSSAVEKCNEKFGILLRNINSINPSKVAAVLKRINSLPDSKFFDDFSRIRLFGEVKINDKQLVKAVFMEITQLGEARITDVGFDYGDQETIKNDLLADIAVKAKNRISLLEDNLGVKLELIKFEEGRSALNTAITENSLYANNNFVSSRPMVSSQRTRKTTDPDYNLDYGSLTYFPVTDFQQTINLTYKILK